MTNFLSKPFTPDQLHEMIDKYFNNSTIEIISKEEFTFSDSLDTVYLKRAYGNDSEYALDMFETYLDIIDDDLLLIQDSIKTNDHSALKKQLHRIKPTFTMVGIGEITKNIESVESELDSMTTEKMEEWFEEFDKLTKSKTPIIIDEINRINTWLKN
jgi:HPt (histidine-containing phosphotransfer) domain-containing protein